MLQEDNMKELRCSLPNDRFRLVGSNATGQLFVGEEPVDLGLAFKKGDLHGRVPFSLEIQEVGTRTPGKVAGGMKGWTDTSGKAPLFDLIGTPVMHPFTVDFAGGDEIPVELKNVPVPRRFGTYAIILVRGETRQFLGTVARVPVPRSDGTIETVPILGEGTFVDKPWRAVLYARMGIRGWRFEGSWNARNDGSTDWTSTMRFLRRPRRQAARSCPRLAPRPIGRGRLLHTRLRRRLARIGMGVRMAAAATGFAIQSTIPNTKSG